jgi:hypothetical protein
MLDIFLTVTQGAPKTISSIGLRVFTLVKDCESLASICVVVIVVILVGDNCLCYLSANIVYIINTVTYYFQIKYK